MTARAVVFGCAGPELTDWERGFFAETAPLGFILFKRNCRDPDQIRSLVSELRSVVDRADAPILIDQEGGRVLRLAPPKWRAVPEAGIFGELALRDPARAREAAWTNARLLALDLRALGIDVNCLPVLDLRLPEGHPSIGDRAFAADPETAGLLGAAVCEGLWAGGVTPVMKHIPGQGRATLDSHKALPRVSTSAQTLESTDFLPFRCLAQLDKGAGVWAMTAHVVFTAYDTVAPATTSRPVIDRVIRGGLGFRGPLISDDLAMDALSGGLASRAEAALAAGCDLVLHGNGHPEEMAEVARAAAALSPEAEARLAQAAALRRQSETLADGAVLARRLKTLLSDLPEVDSGSADGRQAGASL